MPRAKVYVTLKKGILDPQGRAVKESLEALGFRGIEEVRMGKYIEVKVGSADVEMLRKDLTSMCEKLLANPIIEDYRYELE